MFGGPQLVVETGVVEIGAVVGGPGAWHARIARHVGLTALDQVVLPLTRLLLKQSLYQVEVFWRDKKNGVFKERFESLLLQCLRDSLK